MPSIEVNLKDAPEIKRLLQKAIGYKKHKAYIAVFPGNVTINSYWDGGSKDMYTLVDLSSMTVKPLPTSTHPYYDIAARGIQGENEVISVSGRGNIELKILPENYALVCHGYFCGKPATARIYFNEANMPKLLTGQPA